MKRKQTIVVLWLLTICGFACHSLMDLMPLFWSQNIAISDSGATPASMLLMSAVLCLLIPAGAIFCLLFDGGKRWPLWVNVVLAALVALFNIVHACMELTEGNAAQYIIMPLMIVVGLALAWQSVQLMRKDD